MPDVTEPSGPKRKKWNPVGPKFDSETWKRAATANTSKKYQVPRGKRGHPTTADQDYSENEMEFMMAIETWKKKHDKKFPSWSEVYAVLQALGYAKSSQTESAVG